MAVLDIRRHAQRQDRLDSESALSAAGIALCERLAKTAPRYALIVSSPLPRAKETAERIGGRLDAVEPGLLPDLGGQVPVHRSGFTTPWQFHKMATLTEWAQLMRDEPDAHRFAQEQLPTWARIASRVGEKDIALAVSHGGIIDLPALLLAEQMGARLDGAAFGYGEGVRVTFARGVATTFDVLRIDWTPR